MEDKLRNKHGGLTSDHVRDALQWPARAEAAWEDDPDHGRRLIALGEDVDGRAVIAYLLPEPAWDENADTWVVKSARWV